MLGQRPPPLAALVRKSQGDFAVRARLVGAGAFGRHPLLCETLRVCAGAHRAARRAAEALGRSRGGVCSKSGEPLGSTLHARADGAGRVLRLLASPGQHSDLRHAPALASPRKPPCGFAGIPARSAALGRGYVSAKLRASFAADGCAVHTSPKRGMVDPPPWDRAIYARRHHVENLFCRLKDWARIALRHNKTRQSWMGFARLAATMINSRITSFSHRA